MTTRIQPTVHDSAFVTNDTVIPGTTGGLSIESVYHTCSPAAGDTIDVDVRIENTPGPIDAAGVDFAYNAALLQYAGHRAGNLTVAWPFFDAAQLVNVIRVGGFTSTPIPAGTSGVFVTLRFVLNCCDSSTSTQICTQTLVDDLAAMSGACGNVVCIPVATRPSTWGAVKSLYR